MGLIVTPVWLQCDLSVRTPGNNWAPSYSDQSKSQLGQSVQPWLEGIIRRFFQDKEGHILEEKLTVSVWSLRGQKLCVVGRQDMNYYGDWETESQRQSVLSVSQSSPNITKHHSQQLILNIYHSLVIIPSLLSLP